MNERVKDLIIKAGWTNAYTDPKYGFEPVFEGEDRNLACIEKFAELIVRECVDKMESEDSFYGRWMGRVIKEHFGVES